MTIAAILQDPAFNLTDVDRHVLSQTDDEFHYHGWEELQDIIGMPCTLSLLPLPLTLSHLQF